MKLLRTLLFLLVAVLSQAGAKATHLVGGDLGYEYVGETFPGSGIFTYNIRVRMYLNCGASSNYESINALLSPGEGLPIGIYNEDITQPWANKELLATAEVFVMSYQIVTPDLPDDCLLGEGQCIEESILEGTVDLPASATGRHLYMQLFARNQAIDNIMDPGGTGMGFYAFMAPTTIQNSSPVFTGIPVPYICINDTTFFSNSAVDIDGDSLVFSFRFPYDSQGAAGGIMQPPATLNWPLAEAQYEFGYSPYQPFGTDGYASIDPSTGATEYVPTLIGNWVVAVEVEEWRNGQLIGLVRSDLQLLSVPCSENQAPVSTVQPLPTYYQVTAGEQLCIPLSFVDADGDTVVVSSSSAIFDPNQFDPPAQIIGNSQADSLLTTQICWTPACDLYSPVPLEFNLLVSDLACPPAFFVATIQVQVFPNTSSITIDGPLEACAFETSVTYCVEEAPNATYMWSVSGGTIVSGEGEACITVDWGAEGEGWIDVMRVADGCNAITDSPVTLLPSNIIGIDGPLDNCAYASNVSYCVEEAPGATYTWTISGGTITSATDGPCITVDWGAQGQGTISVVRSGEGCGSIGNITVTISPGPPIAIDGPLEACPFQSNISYCTEDAAGATYDWTVTGGTITSGANTACITVEWGSAGTGTITVFMNNGCGSDGSLTVSIGAAPAIDIEGPMQNCSFQSVSTYCTDEIANGVYTWSVYGGTITSGTDGPCITVAWGAAGPGSVQVTRASDQCASSAELPITIVPLPEASFTYLTDTTCAGVRAHVFNTTPGSTSASWNLNGQLVASTDSAIVQLPFGMQTGITLLITGQNGCIGSVTDSIGVASFQELLSFTVPNVFTPNNDGSNDRFELVSALPLSQCATMEVFDRWGRKVFTSDGLGSWNGKAENGEPSADGVYFYLVTINDEKLQGYVHLLR
jgi:gliding motility-associated-like protein